MLIKFMKRKCNKNTVDAAYDLLVQKILDSTLKAGEVVTEFSLAERFKLGRTPIREALKKLEIEGLIQIRNRTKIIQQLSDNDIEEIFDLKILLESNIARVATLKGTASQKRKLEVILMEMKEYKNSYLINVAYNNDKYLKEWLRLDESFHKLLFEMAGNERIIRIIRGLNLQWHRFKIGLMAIEDRIERAVDEHCQIGLAIIKNEPDLAEKAMHDHLLSLKRVLITLKKVFSPS